MGFERMASVLQGVETNFHIDILRPLVEAAGEVCRVKYEPESESEIDRDRGRRLRRIADHVRACSFAIHENVYPDNEKQGYVVRRLIRRAVLDGYQMGIHEAFLFQLPKVVADLMKGPYPELQETVERVAQGLRNEESQFFEVINAGMPRVERLFEETKKAKSKTVSGRETFNLLQTHGFPPELTETLALERGLELDWDGFKKAQQRHEEASGAGQRKELFKQGPLDKIRETLQASEFVGYESESADALVMGLLVNNELAYKLDELDSKLPAVIVLDRSPFYAEMGGQVGDTGWIVGPRGRFEVTDTRTEDDFILHVGHLREGKIEYKDAVKATVDSQRRQAIRRAHSATHLLQYALRKTLGTQTHQKGSKVEADLLRFDFNFDHALSAEQLGRIETEVNARAIEAVPVEWTLMPKEEAQKLGATMLFGEKYPDVVRVVSMGDYSKELCGGTHLANTAQVGLLKIIGEESIAKGIRRITALTGLAAVQRVQRDEALLRRIALTLRAADEDLPERVETLTKQVRELQKKATAAPEGRWRGRRSARGQRRGSARREDRRGRRARRHAAIPPRPDRPVAPQSRPGGGALGHEAGRGQGAAHRRAEPRTGRARAGLRAVDPRAGRAGRRQGRRSGRHGPGRRQAGGKAGRGPRIGTEGDGEAVGRVGCGQGQRRPTPFAIVQAALAMLRLDPQSGRCAATNNTQHGRVYPTPRSPECQYRSANAIPTRIPDGGYRRSCRPSNGFGMERTAPVAGVAQILRLASEFLGSDDLENTIVETTSRTLTAISLRNLGTARQAGRCY